MGLLKKALRRLRTLGQRQSFAMHDLDLKIQRHLDFDKGFFVEAGANDGLQQSNTLYFEKYRGWRGLLIEPVPELARRCRRNRRRCIVENAALVPFDYDRATVPLRACGLMSQVKGAMKSEAEELDHIAAGCRVQRIESREVDCPASPLSAILDRHNIQNVDLLSLDVEGFELPVLRGLDLDRHRPKWMVIEARYRAEIESHLLPLYEPVEELSHSDVLYRCTKLP